MILIKTLTRLGIRVEPTNGQLTDAKVQDVLQEVLNIYDQCITDPDLARAAYGLAIGGTALSLNVTIRTAALLLEHALVLRGMKGERYLKSIGPNIVDIANARTDARHSDDDRSGVGRQAGDSKGPDNGTDREDPATA